MDFLVLKGFIVIFIGKDKFEDVLIFDGKY